MKKVLVCALAVFFLMASCSTAFAATANSVTTYKIGDPSKFTVTTTVTGADNGDKVTYLAYKNSKTEANVTYADQQTVAGGVATFSFDATPENVAVTEVQLGTDSATAFAPATDNLADNVRTVTITVEGDDPIDVTLPDEIPENSFFYVNGITIDSGKVVDHAVISGTEIAAMSTGSNSVILAADDENDELIVSGATIDLKLRAVSNDGINITNVQSKKFNNGTDDVITVYATVTGVNTEEYGINLRLGENGTPEKFQAVAMGSQGQFAVQIIDPNKGLLNADYYANVYVGDSVSTEFKLVPAYAEAN